MYAERLDMFVGTMGVGQALVDDPRTVSLSLESSGSNGPLDVKLDLNAVRAFPSDRAIHERCLGMLHRLGYPDTEYRALQELCAPRLSSSRVEGFTWVGIALRSTEERLNVYLHPTPGRLAAC